MTQTKQIIWRLSKRDRKKITEDESARKEAEVIVIENNQSIMSIICNTAYNLENSLVAQ